MTATTSSTIIIGSRDYTSSNTKQEDIKQEDTKQDDTKQKTLSKKTLHKKTLCKTTLNKMTRSNNSLCLLMHPVCHQRCGEGLGQRADGEPGLRRDWAGLVNAGIAISIGEENPAVLDDGQRQGRRQVTAHQVQDKLMDVLGNGLVLSLVS